MTSKPLTKELIIKSCQTDKLNLIKKINFFANDLDDLSVLAELPNIEMVSLSQNKIPSLKDFANCLRVQEIYLRKNCIADLTEVNYLARLPFLKVLWLQNNPCESHPYYRQYIIKTLPNLIKLDKVEVTPEERSAAIRMNFDSLTSLGIENQYSTPSLNRKPSQASVLQQNNMLPNHQASYQSKSPFKSEQQRDLIQKRTEQRQITPSPQTKKPSSAQPRSIGVPEQRNENILCAVLALMKELSEGELELVKRDIDKKIVQFRQQQ